MDFDNNDPDLDYADSGYDLGYRPRKVFWWLVAFLIALAAFGSGLWSVGSDLKLIPISIMAESGTEIYYRDQQIKPMTFGKPVDPDSNKMLVYMAKLPEGEVELEFVTPDGENKTASIVVSKTRGKKVYTFVDGEFE